MALDIAIFGAGITGLTSALALTKNLPAPPPKITVFEIRSAPSTIGGAVNLTPKALRYLDHLGVYQQLLDRSVGAECKTIDLFDLYSGEKYAGVDFRGPSGTGIGKADGTRFFSRRVMRWQLQEALLEACKKHSNIEIKFAHKVVAIEEVDDRIEFSFEDGGHGSSDLVLGCDGIHSSVRSLFVEPTRKPQYSGISVAMATTDPQRPIETRWAITGLVSSRRGSLMCSYFDSGKSQQYVAAVIEMADVASREGWRAQGSDQPAIESDLLERFKSEKMPEVQQLVESASEWTLYPVYTLPPRGKWLSSAGRCVLLGDAAHAMAPQGESTGICIEDAIVFARALVGYRTTGVGHCTAAYEKYRRSYIEAAIQQAAQRWETVKDSGWLAYRIKCWLTPWFLWWTAGSREEEFAEDLSELVIASTP